MTLWFILNEPNLTYYRSRSEPHHAFVVLFVDGNHAEFDDKMRYLIKVWKECPSILSWIMWCFFTQFLTVSLWFMSLLIGTQIWTGLGNKYLTFEIVKRETYCQKRYFNQALKQSVQLQHLHYNSEVIKLLLFYYIIMWILFVLRASYHRGDFTPVNARGARHQDFVVNTSSRAGVCEHLLIVMYDKWNGFKHLLAEVFS